MSSLDLLPSELLSLFVTWIQHPAGEAHWRWLVYYDVKTCKVVRHTLEMPNSGLESLALIDSLQLIERPAVCCSNSLSVL